MRKTRLLLAFILLAMVSLNLAVGGQHTSAGDRVIAARSLSAPQKQQAGRGFDITNLDKSCEPCKDFNKFANGGWATRNPIPASYPSWASFNVLIESNQEKLRGILEAAAKNTGARKGSIEQRIGDFYASAMDTAQIEKDGLKALAPEFDRIEKINDSSSLQKVIAHLQTLGVNAPFSFSSVQDFKNSSQVIGQATQGGLGLPDRDYYLKDDAKSKQIRDEYVKHLQRTFQLLGSDSAKAEAESKTVVELETKLAGVSLARAQRRDPNATYHKMDLAQLNQLTPSFSWSGFFKNVNHPGITAVTVDNPGFYKLVNSLLTDMPLSGWKTYLRAHFISLTAQYLSSKFDEENFTFNKVFTGAKEMLPRWKRAVTATDAAVGEDLGQVYVKQYFTPDAKARALAMINNLIAALRSDLGTLSWMGEATRKRAIGKLEAFTKKIGYPDKWTNYSSLKIDRGPYVLNVLRSNQFAFHLALDRIGKPVDLTQWGITPPTVNAYYNPLANEIVFPAGILQPPFFFPDADDAINYGGMGAVIGHEMTHGFDDQGAKFDAKGNLEDWWSPEDLKNFQQKTECIVKQFSSYEVEPGLHLNGKLVAGESIADFGGLTIAFAAFKKSLEGKPRPKEIDGFTAEQRFFLGWAHIWAGNVRPEYARLLVTLDPHPAARFRVNGPLSNMPEFAGAYGCKSGDPMVRSEGERCQIW